MANTTQNIKDEALAVCNSRPEGAVTVTARCCELTHVFVARQVFVVLAERSKSQIEHRSIMSAAR